MFKRSLILVCLLCTTSAFSETLKGSVQKTLSKNPEVLAEEYQKEAYTKYVDEKEGDYLPQIDFSAYGEKSRTKTYPDDAADTDARKDGINAKLRLEQLLYNGGRTPAEIRKAEYERDAQKFKSNNNTETVVLGATRAYAELVQYLELLELTENMILKNEDNLVIAKEKEEISGEILETYQVTSKLNFVTEKFLEEQTNEAERMSNLKRFIVEDPQPEFCRPIINEKILPKNLKDTIELALLNNNQILEEIERVKSKRESIAVADSNFLPELTLELQAAIDNDLELPENGREHEVLGRLNLAWNLYNGGTDSATSEKEELFLKEAKKSLEATTEKVVDEIRTVYQSFHKNKERVVALKKYVEANKNIVNVYKEEFDAGTRTFVDILNAQTEHYQSEKDLVNREFALMDDYWTLLFNLSILSETVLTSPDQTCTKKEVVKPVVVEDELTELQAVMTEEPKASNLPAFFEGNQEDYTVNLATYYGSTSGKKFQDSLPFKDETFIYEFGDEKRITKILYGNYPSATQAKEALNALDSNLKKVHRPYIDKMSKHIRLYNTYNK